MKYIDFAENERLSTIVLGMMRISELSEDEVEDLVEAALSIGINTFDLADIYGNGQCEQLLGKVLKRRPDLRDQMWIQSKCGIRKDGFTYFDFSKDYILDSVDGILERLQIERLDSLLLHRPDALMEPEEVAEAFNHLEQAGKVRHFGVSNQNPMMMEFQKTAYAKQFPLLMSSLWLGSEKLKPNDTIAPVINQGTLGIGFIGLAECLVALTGKHHGEDAASQELGLKIVSYIRNRANQFSEEYQHNYSVLATPAEGLSGKFTRRDRKKFGSLPGITDRDYYTNSNHVPVYYKCSARHKAEVEAPYHEMTRGGHIFYVEMDGDATHNPEVIMQVVDMMDRYNIGYGSVNHNRNRCLDCGYENAETHLEKCPKCGSIHLDKLQRITGYLVGTTDRWNKAKLAELNDRVVHN